MKLVVTGGAGFIGSNLANALARLNLEEIKDKTDANEIRTKPAKGEHRKLGKDNEVIALDDLSLGSPSN